jgi:hypothetical protein
MENINTNSSSNSSNSYIKGLKAQILRHYRWRLSDEELSRLVAGETLVIVRRCKHRASHRWGGHNESWSIRLNPVDGDRILDYHAGPDWWGSRLPKKFHEWKATL